MTKASDIIELAFKDAGVLGLGQSLNAEDTADGLKRLNWMMMLWNRKRWLVWHLLTKIITSTGAQSYSVGPQGDFNVALRPDRLENGCFIRQVIPSQPNQVDYPVRILPSMTDYNRIATKTLTSFAYWVFYDSSYPLGNVYFWPIPQASIYGLAIVVKDNLVAFPDENADFALDDLYSLGLEYNLARILRMAYRMPADPELNKLAADALSTIRGANFQIAQMEMPDSLIRRGVYDVYTDQIK